MKQNEEVHVIVDAQQDPAAVLATLQGRATDLQGAQASVNVRIRDLAYAAHTGDAKARAELDAAQAEAARIAAEFTSLSHAIEVAKLKVNDAEALAERERLREVGRQGQAKAAEIREYGARMQAAVETLVHEHIAFSSLVSEVHRLGSLGRPFTKFGPFLRGRFGPR
jgi:hypothetical protein